MMIYGKNGSAAFEWVEEQYGIINDICEYLIDLGYNGFGVTYHDEYLVRPDVYSSWSSCITHNDVDINRKKKFGIIWVR